MLQSTIIRTSTLNVVWSREPLICLHYNLCHWVVNNRKMCALFWFAFFFLLLRVLFCRKLLQDFVCTNVGPRESQCTYVIAIVSVLSILAPKRVEPLTHMNDGKLSSISLFVCLSKHKTKHLSATHIFTWGIWLHKMSAVDNSIWHAAWDKKKSKKKKR